MAVLLTAALVVAACSGDDGASPAPSTSPTGDTSTSTTNSTSPSQAEDASIAAVDEAWTQAWTAAAQPGVTDVANVSAEVGDRLVVTLHPERDDPAADELARTVTNNPTITPGDQPDTYRIDDCLLITPPVAVGQANYYSGTAAIEKDGTVTITAVEPESITGCVPTDVANEVLDDYAAYWSGVVRLSNPPAPDDPELARIATGEHLTFLRGVLERLKSDDDFVLDDPVLHPEISEFRDATTIVVLDCQEADVRGGVYDRETGDRQPGQPSSVPGQVDLREITMKRGEDGRWRVIDRQGSTSTDCQFAPTQFGLPVV